MRRAWPGQDTRSRPGGKRSTRHRVIAALGLVPLDGGRIAGVWCVVTLVLAQWLPKLRATGKPSPPLFWMPWVPWVVAAAWGLVGLGFLVYWFILWWRARSPVPLCSMWLGLASAAALAVALTAVQLLPVIEFTQRTARAAEAGTHEIYPFGVEPLPLVEMVWPNILGDAIRRQHLLGRDDQDPGSSAQGRGYRRFTWAD